MVNLVEFDYPEGIPEHLRTKRFGPHLPEGYAHPVDIYDYWAARERKNLPYGMRDKVCHGYRYPPDSDHRGYTSLRGVPVCKVCTRPGAYLLFYCLSCGSLFIKDFADSRFCNFYPHCWSCLPKLQWPYCPTHSTARGLSSFGIVDFPYTARSPRGFNPRVYTEEELKDVFAFLNE